MLTHRWHRLLFRLLFQLVWLRVVVPALLRVPAFFGLLRDQRVELDDNALRAVVQQLLGHERCLLRSAASQQLDIGLQIECLECGLGSDVEGRACNPYNDKSHPECANICTHLLAGGVVRNLGIFVLLGRFQLVAQIAPDRIRLISSMSGLPPEPMGWQRRCLSGRRSRC